MLPGIHIPNFETILDLPVFIVALNTRKSGCSSHRLLESRSVERTHPVTNQTPKKFAIYARSATVQELTPGFSVAEQVHQCKEYGIAQGYELAKGHVYEEVASGASLTCPLLAKLLEEVGHHAFDVLVIRDYIRLARRQDVCITLLNQFEQAGVRIESVRESFDNSGIEKLTQETMRLVADFERKKRTERMLAGRRRRKSQQA